MWQQPSPPLDLFAKGLRFVHCVDQVTPNSDTAFGNVCDLMHQKDDHLTLLHLFAPAAHAGALALQAHYTTKLLARFSQKRYEVRLLELPPAVPLRSAVLQGVRAEAADLVVLGFRGLHEKAGQSTTLMGSAEDLSLREGHTSALVIKSWDVREAGGAQVILVGLDGSVRSQQALLLALRLARPGRDCVRALYVEGVAAGGVAGEREGDAVEAGARTLLAGAVAGGLDATLLRRPLRAAHSPGHVVHAVADELGATLAVCGADGLGASLKEQRQGLGSCSDHVIKNVSCNVLVFHEPRHLRSVLQQQQAEGGSSGGAQGH
jgi:nucleotide-binding universal stress UspA family protein